jgi:nucleotide-binding universal stress UspA family protein
MKTILVPTDFSIASRNAATYAAQIATVFKAKMILFHAYMLPTPVMEVPYVMVTANELQKQNENNIRKQGEELRRHYGIEVEHLVQIGIPSDEIKLLTQEKKTDLVVMGMKGGAEMDKILGSTAIFAIRKVRSPVIIVPADFNFTPLRKIIYASDFSYEIPPNLFDPLIRLSKAFKASIDILNVHRQHIGVTEDQRAGNKKLETVFNEIDHRFSTIANASVMNGINDYIEHNPAELLAMVAHKHTFFERVFTKRQTTAMAYETKIPLLILKENQ